MAMQGSELKALREAMGLTQSDLAQALGLSSTFIGLMERGEKPIEKRTELAARYVAHQRRPFPPRLKTRASDIDWQEVEQDHVAQIGEFKVVVTPAKGGRWAIYLTHKDGYSVPWPRWEPTLADAKASALLHVQFGLMDLYDVNQQLS